MINTYIDYIEIMLCVNKNINLFILRLYINIYFDYLLYYNFDIWKIIFSQENIYILYFSHKMINTKRYIIYNK